MSEVVSAELKLKNEDQVSNEMLFKKLPPMNLLQLMIISITMN